MKRMTFTLMALAISLSATFQAQAQAYVLQGDMNNDGVLSVTDVTLMINWVLNDRVDEASLSYADMNGDGVLSITDVTMLLTQVMDFNDTPGDQIITVGGVTLTMVYVDGGTFIMGCKPEDDVWAYRNESPVHQVTIDSYYIAQTEVTQELWLAVMGNNPSGDTRDLQLPVENVSYFDCATFVDKLSAMTGLVFRLPTEAEWEFAARGGQYSQWYQYAGSNDVSVVAWYDENSGNGTHPVAMLMANELGIYDMSGNVAEWCQDFYSGYPRDPQVNPVGPESGYTNVVRNGGFDNMFQNCRYARRFSVDPQIRSFNLGLRIAMNP